MDYCMGFGSWQWHSITPGPILQEFGKVKTANLWGLIMQEVDKVKTANLSDALLHEGLHKVQACYCRSSIKSRLPTRLMNYCKGFLFALIFKEFDKVRVPVTLLCCCMGFFLC